MTLASALQVISSRANPMNFDVSKQIKEMRTERGLSTNKLSNMAGLSQSYVRKLEKGETKPTVESLGLLCQALGITLEDLVAYKDKSLQQLRAIIIIGELSDEQLEGFCQLVNSSIKGIQCHEGVVPDGINLFSIQ